MKNYRYVLWDFNGTLLDDVSTGIAAVNTLLRRRGKPEIPSRDAYRRVFRFPIIDYYKDIGFDFSAEDFDTVAVEWMREYELNDRPVLCHGVKNALEKFRRMGVQQLIISASEIRLLRRQLRDLGIDGYFSDVRARNDIYAADKTSIAVNWAAHAPPAPTVFIGDTTHDAETARAIGADCVLVANGHQCRETLEKCGFPVADTADEIFDLL